MPRIHALPPTPEPLADDDEFPIHNISTGDTEKSTLSTLKTYLQALVGWISTAMLADSSITGVKMGQPVAFKVYNASGTSFTNGVDSVKATWANEKFDYGNNFASNKFTAPYNGIYHFDAELGDWSASATRSFLSFYKNGASIAIGQDAASRKCDASCTLELAAGDYIEVYGFQSSGANRTGGSSENGPYFMGYLVGRT